jgi:CheY-like chemotaxis protein
MTAAAATAAPRVLFVDDEPFVLRAIERLLRVRRAPIDARFVGSGADALARLAVEPFDVVVTDLSMPAMDGVTLLGEVRARHPHIARIALSGQAASGDSVRAVKVVHQWLSKPCDVTELCANIERVAWARDLIGDPELAARICAAQSLPSPPRLFLRVSAALARMAPLPEVASMIETDPALVAKLLQLVNSAFFGPPERVTSVTRAAALVGTETLRGLLLSAELFHGDARAEALAEHSLLVASVARVVAPSSVAADAFLTAVVHDVGELLLPPIAGPPAPPTLHARAGAMLLGLWGLPSDVVTAVAFHHDPEAAPAAAAPLVKALAIAQVMVAEQVVPPSGLAPTPPLPEGLDPAQVNTYREAATRLLRDRRGTP